jgi:sugar phosphate isomerase/epimerase
VARTRVYGISTHLYHGERLSRDHLVEVATHGFERVELFATRTHFDYHNPAAVGDLQQWLAEASLELHGVHAPVGESFAGGRWGPLYSLASPDEPARARALAEAEQALYIARRLPFHVLVAHLGVPTVGGGGAANSRDAARRSIEALARLAEPLGVRVAIEVIPNELSRPGSIVHFIEEVLDDPRVGICLDFGHAHMGGDLVDAIEIVAEHLITTHVHDNHGRSDEHLLPFEGTIGWPEALTGVQKIGYDGALLLEVGPQGSASDTLQRAGRARDRMNRLLAE